MHLLVWVIVDQSSKHYTKVHQNWSDQWSLRQYTPNIYRVQIRQMTAFSWNALNANVNTHFPKMGHLAFQKWGTEIKSLPQESSAKVTLWTKSHWRVVGNDKGYTIYSTTPNTPANTYTWIGGVNENVINVRLHDCVLDPTCIPLSKSI